MNTISPRQDRTPTAGLKPGGLRLPPEPGLASALVRRRLTDRVRRATGLVVIAGAFAGMSSLIDPLASTAFDGIARPGDNAGLRGTAATIGQPGTASRDPDALPGNAQTPTTGTLARQGDRLIGELVGAEYRILMYAPANPSGGPGGLQNGSAAGPNGLGQEVRYTLLHRATDRTLAERLTADELYRQFPELDLRRLLLEPVSNDALMIAEER